MGFLTPVHVPGKEWQMCYLGSEQNFRASAFHSLCDYKGPTVTIVRVNQNVFGGYTDKNWTSGKNRVRIPNQILGSSTICRTRFPAKTVFMLQLNSTLFEKMEVVKNLQLVLSFYLCLSVCLSVCLFVCLSVYEHLKLLVLI